MKAHKAARELGLRDFSELKQLPSGYSLTPQADVSPYLLKILRREAAAGAADTSAVLRVVDEGEKPVADAPRPAVPSQREATEPQAGDALVFQLARELVTYVDNVIAALRDVSGRSRWTPSDVVAPEIADAVRSSFSRRNNSEARSAGAPVRPRVRPSEVLETLRVQCVKDCTTKGEEALAERLRGLSKGIVLMGVDLPSTGSGRNTDVDAIVCLPSLVATVEVKDTRKEGVISAFRNGPWLVDGEEFQDCGRSPVGQALQQARVLGGARSERVELRDLHRVPATVGVFGKVQFERRPLFAVSEECFGFNVDDAVPALTECAGIAGARVTIGHMLAVFEWLELSPALRFSRSELEMLGFSEQAAS